MNRRYLIRPKADRDLEDQAAFYGTEANPEVGHRFLVAAHATFALLASQPEMGWRCRFVNPSLIGLRKFVVKDFNKILILYRPSASGVEILRVVHGAQDLKAFFRRDPVV